MFQLTRLFRKKTPAAPTSTHIAAETILLLSSAGYRCAGGHIPADTFKNVLLYVLLSSIDFGRPSLTRIKWGAWWLAGPAFGQELGMVGAWSPKYGRRRLRYILGLRKPESRPADHIHQNKSHTKSYVTLGRPHLENGAGSVSLSVQNLRHSGLQP